MITSKFILFVDNGARIVGIVMEYSFSIPRSSLNTEDPWELCYSLPSEYHHSCAGYQPFFFRGVFGWDFSRSAAECFVAETQDMREICLIHLGYSAAQESLGDSNQIPATCGLISKPEGQHMCIIGAANEVIFQAYPGWEEVYQSLCNELPENAKQRCLESSQYVIKTYRDL